MRKNKKVLAAIVSIIMVVGCVTGCGNSGSSTPSASVENTTMAVDLGEKQNAAPESSSFATATYSLNQPNPEVETDSYFMLARLFADKVKAKTGGAVTINIYSNGQLGYGADAALGVEMGTIDFNVDSTNVFSAEYPKLVICDLPYMFNDVQEVTAFCKSEHMQLIRDEMANDLGVRLLAFGDGGFRAVWSTKRNVFSVEDYKGLKIRVPDVPIYVDTFNAVGANATPMSGAEVFTSLQQGTIDACEVPLSVGISQGFTEACKYVTMDNHLYNLISIQCSESTWKKMSRELQDVMVEAAAEAQEEQIQFMSEVNGDLIEKIVGEGCEYVAADKVDFTGIRESVKPVYDSWREKIGQEFYDDCMDWFAALHN